MYVELTVVSRIEKRAQCILDRQGHPITTLLTRTYHYMYLITVFRVSNPSRTHKTTVPGTW